MIRTLDPHVPNVVRYQTALHSVTSGASIDQRFSLHKQGIAKSREKVETFVTGLRIRLIFLGLRDRSDRAKVLLTMAKEAVAPLNKTGAVAKKSPVGNFKYRSHPSISRLMVSQ